MNETARFLGQLHRPSPTQGATGRDRLTNRRSRPFFPFPGDSWVAQPGADRDPRPGSRSIFLRNDLNDCWRCVVGVREMILRGWLVAEAGAAGAGCHNVAAGVAPRGVAEQIAKLANAGTTDGDPLSAVAIGGVARQEAGAVDEDPGALVTVRLAVGDRGVVAQKYPPALPVIVSRAVADRVVAALPHPYPDLPVIVSRAVADRVFAYGELHPEFPVIVSRAVVDRVEAAAEKHPTYAVFVRLAVSDHNVILIRVKPDFVSHQIHLRDRGVLPAGQIDTSIEPLDRSVSDDDGLDGLKGGRGIRDPGPVRRS
jgi:hypothetical protein